MTAPRTYWAGQGVQVGCNAGTAGCFVRRSDGQILLMSNAHVLFGASRPVVDRVVRTPTSSSSCCRGDHFADTIGDPVFQEATTGQGSHEWRGILVDAALAALRPDVLIRNEIPEIGMISGVPSDRGFEVGAPLGRDPDPEHLVRMYSRMRGQVVYGTILSAGESQIGFPSGGGFGRRTRAWLEALGVSAGALPPFLYPRAVGTSTSYVAQYAILPRLPPSADADYEARYRRHIHYDPEGRPFGDLAFGVPGDSGSVIVNHRDEVIGLYHGGSSQQQLAIEHDAVEFVAAEEFGLATPIQFVLDHADVDIPGGLTNITPAHGSLPYPESQVVERGLERLRASLATTRLGQLVIGKIERHREEANHLVNRVREVGLTWHRNRGPGFVQHARENVRDPASSIPVVINGRDRATLLSKMADMFERHGSERLRRDVARYRDIVLECLATATSLDDAVLRLGNEEAATGA